VPSLSRTEGRTVKRVEDAHLIDNFRDKWQRTLCQAMQVPVAQKVYKPLLAKLGGSTVQERVSTVMEIIGLESQTWERTGIKLMRALNFPAQIITGDTQPFARVTIRVVP
jgi:hypothetical protein